MRSLLTTVLTLLLWVAGTAAGHLLTGTVVRVLDGDTLDVLSDKGTVRVRLWGVDAPETKQPYGGEANQYLTDLVEGKRVVVWTHDTDRYGRVIGDVFGPDGSLSKQLLRAGLAHWYRQYAPEDLGLATSETYARNEREGLWADPDPVPPWVFRKQK